MITVWSVANPNQNAALFRLVYREEQAPVPGYRELLPVLWELDIFIEERFSDLFAARPEGFRPLWRQEAREMLITWETYPR
jgi:hypothetical protein